MIVWLFLFFCYFSAAGQNKFSDILGTWTSNEELRIFSVDVTYDRLVGRMDSQKFTFYEDGIMSSSSGFFTSKGEPFNESEKLPWIYCGNFAKFKVTDNTLEVFHPGNKEWMIFEIISFEPGEIRLRRNGKVFHLLKTGEDKNVSDEKFTQFQVEVFNESFLMYKRLTFDRKDNLIVENLLEESSQPRYLKLPEGYFNFLCRRVNANQVMTLDTLYSETESRSGNSVTLRMRGQSFKEILVIGKGPDKFTWSVVLMMFSEDLIDHPNSWLKVDFSEY